MNVVQENSIHCERKHILLTFLGANFQTIYYLLDERVKSDRFIGLCPAFCMAISGKTVFFWGQEENWAIQTRWSGNYGYEEGI